MILQLHNNNPSYTTYALLLQHDMYITNMYSVAMQPLTALILSTSYQYIMTVISYLNSYMTCSS